MREASVCVPAKKMKDLLAIMLTQFGKINYPNEIWDVFRDDLSENFLHKIRMLINDNNIEFSNSIFKQALIALEDRVLELGGKKWRCMI